MASLRGIGLLDQSVRPETALVTTNNNVHSFDVRAMVYFNVQRSLIALEASSDLKVTSAQLPQLDQEWPFESFIMLRAIYEIEDGKFPHGPDLFYLSMCSLGGEISSDMQPIRLYSVPIISRLVQSLHRLVQTYPEAKKFLRDWSVKSRVNPSAKLVLEDPYYNPIPDLKTLTCISGAIRNTDGSYKCLQTHWTSKELGLAAAIERNPILPWDGQSPHAGTLDNQAFMKEFIQSSPKLGALWSDAHNPIKLSANSQKMLLQQGLSSRAPKKPRKRAARSGSGSGSSSNRSSSSPGLDSGSGSDGTTTTTPTPPRTSTKETREIQRAAATQRRQTKVQRRAISQDQEQPAIGSQSINTIIGFDPLAISPNPAIGSDPIVDNQIQVNELIDFNGLNLSIESTDELFDLDFEQFLNLDMYAEPNNGTINPIDTMITTNSNNGINSIDNPIDIDGDNSNNEQEQADFNQLVNEAMGLDANDWDLINFVGTFNNNTWQIEVGK